MYVMYYELECNKCGSLANAFSRSKEDTEREALYSGWIVLGKRHFCAECKHAEIVEAAAEAARKVARWRKITESAT